MAKKLFAGVYNDWIHWFQIIALVILGMTIFVQDVLSRFGLEHRTAIMIAFIMLLISLGVEHRK